MISRGISFRLPFNAVTKNSKCSFVSNSNVANIVTNSSVVKAKHGNFSTFALNVQQLSFVGSTQCDIRKRLLLFNDCFIKANFRPIIAIRYFSTTERPDGNTKKAKDNVKKKPGSSSLVDKKNSEVAANPVIDSLLYDKYRAPEPTTTAEKVTRNVKDFTYLLVLLGAFGVTSLLLWYGGLRDVFSSKTPTNVFSRALKVVQNDERVIDALGNPIKGYGEETGRGRRRNVSHVVYMKDGVEHMKVVFYVKGPNGTATVRLEVKENENGYYDYRYLLVQLDTYPMKTIVLIDNR